jgi:hypothetical protein
MAYATYDELIARYPILASWAATPVLVSSHLIYYSERRLDSMLAVAFSVPFTVTHPTITDITLDLCYFRAMLTKDPEKADPIGKDLFARIKSLIEGKEGIYTSSGTTLMASGAAGAVIWSSTMDYHNTFGMLDAEDPFTMVSSEKLYAEESERG